MNNNNNVATNNAVAATIAETFDFDVDMFPLTGPDNEPTGHYGLRRDDMMGKKAWLPQAVSSDFVMHHTPDVITLADAGCTAFDLDKDNTEVKASWIRRGKAAGHTVSIRPTRQHRLSIYGERDNIFPMIQIRALYGGSAFRGSVGMYRDACKNMTMIQSVASTSVALRHTGQFRENFDSLVEQFQELQHGWENLAEVAASLQAVEVNVAEFMAQMFPATTEVDSQRTIASHQRRIETIVRRVAKEKFETGRPTDLTTASLWECVNGVTGYVQHDRTRRGNPTAADRAFAAIDDTMCRDAWALGISLAS